MPPGRYTVRLTVDGQELTRSLMVLKDPNSAGSEADIADQVSFLAAVRAEAVAAGEAVERVEVLRVQIENLIRFSEDEEVKEAAAAVGSQLEDLQMTMVDLRLTGQGQDGVRFEAKLLQKFGYLTGGVSVADFPPTDQDQEVLESLRGQLADHLRALAGVENGVLAALNRLLEERGVPVIGYGIG
jgi:hypothetical protein